MSNHVIHVTIGIIHVVTHVIIRAHWLVSCRTK
jgi:hypothetical protein